MEAPITFLNWASRCFYRLRTKRHAGLSLSFTRSGFWVGWYYCSTRRMVNSSSLVVQSMRSWHVRRVRPQLPLHGTFSRMEGFGVGWELVLCSLNRVTPFVGIRVCFFATLNRDGILACFGVWHMDRRGVKSVVSLAFWASKISGYLVKWQACWQKCAGSNLDGVTLQAGMKFLECVRMVVETEMATGTNIHATCMA